MHEGSFENKLKRRAPKKAVLAMVAIVARSAAIVCVALTLLPAAYSQERVTPGGWLDQLDREHNNLVSSAGHVHARGKINAVDMQAPGSITITIHYVESADGTIRMPAMDMPFHVTNRRMLRGLRAGDVVEFTAARLRNAIMITNIGKAP